MRIIDPFIREKAHHVLNNRRRTDYALRAAQYAGTGTLPPEARLAGLLVEPSDIPGKRYLNRRAWRDTAVGVFLLWSVTLVVAAGALKLLEMFIS